MSSNPINGVNNIKGQLIWTYRNINNIFQDMKNQSAKKAAFKRVERNVQKQYFDKKRGSYTAEDFDAALKNYFESGSNKSRIFKEYAAVQQYQKSREQIKDQIDVFKYKEALYSGYITIMAIRRQVTEQSIEYGLYLISTGKNSNITMGSPSIEELFAISNLSVGSRGISLQLQVTANDMKDLMNEFTNTSSPLANQFNQQFQNESSQALWEIIQMVKQKIKYIANNNKNIFYSYGQLLEVFVHLQNKTSLTTNDIYKALKQGRNTVSFEKQGDFHVQFNGEDFDVQAKTLSMNLDDDSTQKLSSRANLIKLSNITRVLGDLIIIFDNPNNILQSLKEYFSIKLDQNWEHIETFGENAGTEEFEKQVEPIINKYNKLMAHLNI